MPERRVVQAGMTLPEVVGVLGTHYKKCNHSLVGHYTLVYDDVAVRIRDGRVYDIEPSSAGWIEMMKDVPNGLPQIPFHIGLRRDRPKWFAPEASANYEIWYRTNSPFVVLRDKQKSEIFVYGSVGM